MTARAGGEAGDGEAGEARRGHGPVRVLVGAAQLALIGVGIASLCGALAWWWPEAWALDLFNHVRPRYAVVSGLAALIFAVGRRWRWSLASLVLFAFDLALIAPFYRPFAAAPKAGAGVGLRLVHFNLLSSNREYSPVADYLAASGAELVFLQEVSPAWAEKLARVPGYRLLRSLPRRDNFGLAVLAAVGSKVERAEEVELGGGVPALRVEVEVDGRRVSILSVHTPPPVSAEHSARRDQMLHSAGQWALERRSRGALPVILGDLNATTFSRPLRALLEDAELVDSQRGFGLEPSWPTSPALHRLLFGISIDHALHDPQLSTRARRLGPDLGSDHRPLEVELATPQD